MTCPDPWIWDCRIAQRHWKSKCLPWLFENHAADGNTIEHQCPTLPDIASVIASFNPGWQSAPLADLPTWRRTAFQEFHAWLSKPPAHRAVLMSGARQIGKTTLMLQGIEALLSAGVPAANILYATFDHPLLKLAGIEAVIAAWREREPRVSGPEYLFLDEAQFIRQDGEALGTWIKHQVDFRKDRRIVFTGSSMPLLEAGQESGVGRNSRKTGIKQIATAEDERADDPKPRPSML